TSGRGNAAARPRAAFSNFLIPSGVSGRSSSGMSGVPRWTAMAWRMSSRCMPISGCRSRAAAHGLHGPLQQGRGPPVEERAMYVVAGLWEEHLVQAGLRRQGTLALGLRSGCLLAQPLGEHVGVVDVAQVVLQLLQQGRGLGLLSSQPVPDLGCI